jgi:hypothetical protein
MRFTSNPLLDLAFGQYPAPARPSQGGGDAGGVTAFENLVIGS